MKLSIPIKISIFFFALLFFFACKRDTMNTMNCDFAVTSFLNYYVEGVQSEIDKLCEDLEPKKTDDDLQGHKENFTILMKRIEEQCDQMNVVSSCYACLESNPPQSEIKFEVDSFGYVALRGLRILTPDDDVLSFRSLFVY
jgi:hypothetical protein